MKNFYLLFSLIIISYCLFSQGLSGEYSVGIKSSQGQFASFSNDMNSVGSISCNSASNVIKGVGTSFSKIFQPDDIIYDKGGWACGVAIGQIATVNNNTTITLY
nr:hypothetical protein [Bacteroidales bacterium]